MKLILVALLSCLLGTAVGVGALLLTEDVGAEDLLGFAPLMFAAAALTCGLAYAPGLFWLRRRKGCEPAAAFPLVAAFVLNLPVFLFFAFALSAGKFFSGPGEVLLFALAFVAAGLAFGRGFVWYCRGLKPAAG
ncbi:MAG TPA: hypothetical protein VF659_15880 [Pyrinomonadaceae bacterium]